MFILQTTTKGLSLLCGGGKSEKLAMAFETFDSDGDGGLTRRELWRFLRSFLATVLNFATRREVDGVASSSSWDGVIVEAVAAVFKEIPQAQDGVLRSTITFDDFGAWYNEQGSEKLPWLELLDLRKWPEVTSDADARNNGDDTAMNPEVDDLSTATDEAPSFNEDGQDYDDDDQDFDYEVELKAFQAARARGDFDAALNHVTPSLAPPAPSTTTSSRPLLPPSSMFADEEDEAASAAEKESALMLERRRSADDVERKRREGESVPLFSTPLNTFGDWLEVRDVDVEHMRRIVGSTRLLAMEPLELASVIVQALRSADPTAAGSDGASQTNVRRNIWNVPLRDSDFLAILEELVPESMLDEEEGGGEEEGENVRFAEEALAIVFAGLGSSSSQRCTASELIAGLTVLCVGDKSDKLAVAFDAFDVGGRGCMDKMQMVSFLRSFLSVLLSLTVGIRHRDLESEDEMSSLALTSEVTAVELAERIFSDLGLDDGDGGGSVEFDQFAEWYTKQGYEILQWLELLDRRKWPGQPQFEFALAGVGGERDVAARLRVYPEDATLLQNLLRATNFERVGISEILDVVRAVASGGKVTQSDFNRCVRTFVGGPMTNRDDISLVSGVLSSIFNIMDRDDTRSIHVDDAVGALALFSSGSKSDKLATVFDAFDVDRLGWLTKRQLWRCLRSFLSSIASLCGGGGGGGGGGATGGSGGAASSASASSSSSLSASSIDNACVALTDRIFEDADLHDDEDRITFEEFADWYTYTGFEYAPWLELLDQKKWFVGGDVVEMAEESEMSEESEMREESEMTEESETEDEESYTEEMNDSLDATAANDAFGLLDTDDDDEPLGDQSLVVVGTAMPIRSSPPPVAATTNDDDDDADDDDDVLLECLEYKLSESVTNSNLSIGPKGCDTLAFFLELSQFGTIPAPFVRASVFSVCDDTTRCLDERTFRATMRNLVSASRGECGLRPANLEEMSFVDALMTKIFNAFDDDGLSEGALADELACGASLFASGSKSEKLAECFDMFDQNGTGDLGRITFSRYLTSILTALGQWDEGHWEERRNYPDPRNVRRMVAAVIEELVATIFSEAEIGSNGTITFASFADWYTNVGFTCMPWIELIDMRKWPHEAYQEATEAMLSEAASVAASAAGASVYPKKFDMVSGGGGGASNDAVPVVLPVFNVQLNTDGDSLRVYQRNINDLVRLQSLTRFSDLTHDDIVRVVDLHGTGGAVEPENFNSIVDMFVDQSLSRHDQQYVRSFLQRLYSNFDREMYEVVDASEIVAGLTVLAPGTKSDKLASIFHLYDEGHQDVLERYQLHCFLRCLLVTLSTLADIHVLASVTGEEEEGEEDDSETTPTDRGTAVDMAALEMTDRVFSEVSVDGNVSFDDFADWYTSGGHQVMPWLELLDLSKWRSREDEEVEEVEEEKSMPAGVEGRSRKQSFLNEEEAEEAVRMAGRSRKQSFLNEEEAEVNNDLPIPLFEFSLSDSIGSKLSVYPKDVEMISDTIQLARLRQRSPDDLWGLLGLSDGDGDEVTLDRFEQCLHHMLRSGATGVTLYEEDKYDFVSAVMKGVFHSLDSENGRRRTSGGEEGEMMPSSVRVDELIGGFSVFVGHGSKSEKLAAIFDTFDTERKGLIGKNDLYRYVRCVLSTLCYLTMVVPGREQFIDSGSGGKMGDSMFGSVVHQAASEVTGDIWSYRDAIREEEDMMMEMNGEDEDEDKKLISFETFASWYTNGGYEVAAWLELLDHKKWLFASTITSAVELVADTTTSDPARRLVEKYRAQEEEGEKEVSDGERDEDEDLSIYSPLFEFPIDASHRIVLCRQDCQILRYLLWICRLDEIAPIEAVAAMSKTLTENNSGHMDRVAFQQFVSSLCPLETMSSKETERNFFRVTMNHFYDTFDQADVDTVVGERRLVQARSAMLCSGMLLFCRGSKSEKLAMAFDMFVAPGETDAVDEEMFSLFLLSFMIMISSLTKHGQNVDTGILHLAARGLARVVYTAVGPTRCVGKKEEEERITTLVAPCF